MLAGLYGSSIKYDTVNVAVSGEKIDPDMINEGPTEVDPRYAVYPGRAILLFWGGANDLGASVPPATVWTKYQQYVAARRAATPGIKIIGFTLIKTGVSGNPNFEVDRTTFNNLLLASGTTVVDAIVDAGAAAQFQDPNDTTYYNADKVHLNATGNEVLAPLVKTQMDAVLTALHISANEEFYQLLANVA